MRTEWLENGCLWQENLKNSSFSSCSDAERQWSGPFCFIQAADPQLGLMKAWRDGDCDSGGEEWAEEVELTKQAVEAVNNLRPRPRFMVLCGDLVHAMPGRNHHVPSQVSAHYVGFNVNTELKRFSCIIVWLRDTHSDCFPDTLLSALYCFSIALKKCPMEAEQLFDLKSRLHAAWVQMWTVST